MLPSNFVIRRYEKWFYEEENELIKLFKDGYSDYDISKRLLRTLRGIKDKRLELNLYKETNRKKWSDMETLLLKNYFFGGKTNREIGKKLGRSFDSIQKKRKQLGLIRDVNYWSDAEIKLLKYLKFEKYETDKEIANKIGRSPEGVKDKLRNMRRCEINENVK